MASGAEMAAAGVARVPTRNVRSLTCYKTQTDGVEATLRASQQSSSTHTSSCIVFTPTLLLLHHLDRQKNSTTRSDVRDTTVLMLPTAASHQLISHCKPLRMRPAADSLILLLRQCPGRRLR